MEEEINLMKSDNYCDLSIILPCYNAENIIPNSISSLQDYFNKSEISWEIIVVDDGSTDRSAYIINNVNLPNFQSIKLIKNEGKGKAIAAGIMNANGKCCVFVDIDLPYELEIIGEMWYLLDQGKYQAVFGNRKLENSEIKINMSKKRNFLSSLFSFLVSLIITRKDLDTQCGCKGFSRELAIPLFQALTVNRFAFDVELCLLLTLSKIKIKSLPVIWVNNSPSTISIRNTGHQVILDLGKIFLNKVLGLYDLTDILKVKTAMKNKSYN